ncbi:MoxR family ATPase [Planococcus sp. N028]|uniref:MoxR family ATPase n=1 Tax=Planococcus shixiaomingii TaxID=3058393 RepID=A0ABT8MZE7_9BACL|nr:MULTISPECIES: MoxR family ATPase [unclassified Planococcus (in: firmicutes)]MDN7241016.1 MoxR family ATPase [Planococcus sp. N028]WKA53270.1 MoxR family ATPase [Planococcus sp. N022]
MSLIQQDIASRSGRAHGEYSTLIGEGGYIAPDKFLWQDILSAVVLRKPVLLKGPTGAGKTKLAESISSTFSQPMQSINCSVDLDAEALLGFKTLVQRDGQSAIEFVEGPVVTAMKKGHFLYIDEINMAKAETLPILHSALDHRRMMTNPFTGEVIQAHPDFGVIAAINEGYIGTTPMNEALKNRFIAYPIPYLTGGQLAELWDREFPDAPKQLKDFMLELAGDLMKQVENGLLSEEAASIRSLLDATALSLHMDPLRAVQYAIAEKLEDESERDLFMDLAHTWKK